MTFSFPIDYFPKFSNPWLKRNKFELSVKAINGTVLNFKFESKQGNKSMNKQMGRKTLSIHKGSPREICQINVPQEFDVR